MAMLVRERLNLPADERETLFLLSWTNRAEEALEAELSEEGALTEKAALLSLTGLLGRLKGQSKDVFETEKRAYLIEAEPFLSFDTRLATKQQREAASERLLTELERTGGECVFGKYPLLRELLDRSTERFVEVSRELLERLARDRGEISRRFFAGGELGRITQIKTEAGDQHFHGRSTCVIETERGQFVYKPHDCRIDVKLRELVEKFFPEYMRVPDCLAREGYGWCEYIETREVGTEAGVGRFYRRFGAACALMQALGGSDLHSENWICSGEYPALVDVETVLSPVPRVFVDERGFPKVMTAEENFLHDANRSLIPSSLLPSRVCGRETSVLLDGSDKTSCEPVFRGRKRTVLGYETEFFAGFSDGYDRCIERREELLRELEGFRDLLVRKLVRNTDAYAGLLKMLFSAPALHSEERRATYVRRLGRFFKERGAEHMLSIARWEEQCLLEGDIPYFCAQGGGHSLLGYDNVIVEDFFELSAVENARERLGRMCAAEKKFELGLLSQSIARATIPVQEHKEAALELSDYEPLSTEEAVAEAIELFRRVDEVLLTGLSGKASWLMVSERSKSLVAARPSMFQGTAGMGAFFAAVYALGGETAARARELAGICLAQLDEAATQLQKARRIPERALRPGISDGFAGALRTLDIMERGLGGGEAASLTQRLLELLGKVEIETAHYQDVYSGVAGLLLELCRAYDTTGFEPVLMHIRRAAERLLKGRTLEHESLLLWDTMDKKRPISGAGHGMAGIAAALSGAARILGDERYREAALAALAFEHRIYSEKLGTWPDLRGSPMASRAMHGLCSGAPGIGLALLYCKANGLGSPELDEDLERAKHCCLTRRALFRDHLCCGNLSTVDFLMTLPGQHGQAGRLLALMRSRKDAEGGYRYMPASLRQVFSPDLFFGASGVGYEMLRYARPDMLYQILF